MEGPATRVYPKCILHTLIRRLLFGVSERFGLFGLFGAEFAGDLAAGDLFGLDVVADASTILGLARVVVSPTSVKLEMPAMTRRMILPERVLGMSGMIHTLAGRAILPISCRSP